MKALTDTRTAIGGDLCDEDKAANDDALEHGGRLMSAYNCPDYPDGKNLDCHGSRQKLYDGAIPA